MKLIRVNVAQDFSKYPGGRYESDGPYSAESLRFLILSKITNVNNQYHLYIDLDGTVGYAASFLEEVFSGLIRENVRLPSRLTIKSDEEPYLISEIFQYLFDALSDF